MRSGTVELTLSRLDSAYPNGYERLSSNVDRQNNGMADDRLPNSQM